MPDNVIDTTSDSGSKDSGELMSGAVEALTAGVDLATPAALRAEAPAPAPAPSAEPAQPTPEPAPAEAPTTPAEPSKPGDATQPGQTEPAAPAAPGAAPAAAAAPDAVNDPIPDNLSTPQRERIVSLIGKVKEISGERDRILGERDEILGMIHNTRASPEQFGQVLNYLSAVNSGDRAQVQQAIAMLHQELQTLAAVNGVQVPGLSLLATHQDLQAAVQSGDLTIQHAEELAAARSLRAVQQQEALRHQQSQHVQSAVNQGKADLNALEAQLRSDPQYAAKREFLVPMLQPIMAQLPPQQWAGAFRAAYERLSLPNGAGAVGAAHPGNGAGNGAAAPQAPAHQPLRARQPAPAGNSLSREPANMLEAMNAGIAQASRR